MTRSITILVKDNADVASTVEDMKRAAGRYASSLHKLHPDSTDARLSRYFTIEVPDDAIAQITAAVRRCASVDAAYVKPREALP